MGDLFETCPYRLGETPSRSFLERRIQSLGAVTDRIQDEKKEYEIALEELKREEETLLNRLRRINMHKLVSQKAIDRQERAASIANIERSFYLDDLANPSFDVDLTGDEAHGSSLT